MNTHPGHPRSPPESRLGKSDNKNVRVIEQVHLCPRQARGPCVSRMVHELQLPSANCQAAVCENGF